MSPEQRQKISEGLRSRGKADEPKRCMGCDTVKERSEFGRRPNGHSRAHCKDCERDRSRDQYRQMTPEQIRERNRATSLMRHHGVTVEQYEELFEKQGGLCAICKQPETSSRRLHLSVDHCHDSLRVRGLLCSNCNSAMGLFNDDPGLLAAAIAYLQGEPTGMYSQPWNGRVTDRMKQPRRPNRTTVHAALPTAE